MNTAATDVNLHVYDRIAVALPGMTRDEVETADSELRQLGLAIQTHGDANAIARVLVTLRIAMNEDDGSFALAGTLPSARRGALDRAGGDCYNCGGDGTRMAGDLLGDEGVPCPACKGSGKR